MDRALLSLIVAAVGIGLAYLGFAGVDPRSALASVLSGKEREQAPLFDDVLSGRVLSQAGGNLMGNRAIAYPLAARRGWTGRQWTALDTLWTRESGWSNTARNPRSGAYGIPQALPYTKLPREGQPPPHGRSDARAQIRWGLEYIAQRYGTPRAALAHSNSTGWY